MAARAIPAASVAPRAVGITVEGRHSGQYGLIAENQQLWGTFAE